MKTLYKLGLTATLLTAVLISPKPAHAALFTAVSSGNWSSSATWGGSVPSFNVITDQLVIPAGITVTMDQNAMVNGLVASINVEGTLAASVGTTLTVNTGSVSGGGALLQQNLMLYAGSAFSFTGNVVVNTMTVATNLSSSADYMVVETLTLAGGTMSLLTNGSLDVGANAVILVSGGVLSLSGGTVGLAGPYGVVYDAVSAVAGVELSGSGLDDITVNVGSGNDVLLTAALTVDGTLTLSSGSLDLNGNNLIISTSGDVAASGDGIIATTLGGSNVAVNSSGGLTGALHFGTNGSIDGLTINVGSPYSVFIEGSLMVNGNLALTSGYLNFSGADLIIDGSLSGPGSLRGNASANLTISTFGGLPGGLTFAAGGQSVGDLNINVGIGNSVALNSNLAVYGTLNLATGNSLDISGNALTIATSGDITGSGALIVDSGSDLFINATAGISSDVSFTGGTLGDLTVNTGGLSSVTLGSNLTVAGTLTLQAGTLVLNGYDLTVSGNIAEPGIGDISSTALSNLIINTATSPNGSVRFSPTGSTINNLTINIANSGSVSFDSDFDVSGQLTLVSGSIDIGDNNLQIGAIAAIIGADATSYVIVGTNGTLSMQVTAGATDSTFFPVGTSLQFAPAAIELNVGSTSGVVSVGVTAGVLSNGVSGYHLSANQPVVALTWHVSSDISSNLSLNLRVLWNAVMEVNAFNRAASYISHYASGSWDVKATASAQPEVNGMFSLQRTNVTSLSPFAVFDQNTSTGLSSVQADDMIHVYPNPASNFVQLTIESGTTVPLSVEVYSLTGQQVKAMVITNNPSVISLGELEKGGYFIKAYNQEFRAVTSITKM